MVTKGRGLKLNASPDPSPPTSYVEAEHLEGVKTVVLSKSLIPHKLRCPKKAPVALIVGDDDTVLEPVAVTTSKKASNASNKVASTPPESKVVEPVVNPEDSAPSGLVDSIVEGISDVFSWPSSTTAAPEPSKGMEVAPVDTPATGKVDAPSEKEEPPTGRSSDATVPRPTESEVDQPAPTLLPVEPVETIPFENDVDKEDAVTPADAVDEPVEPVEGTPVEPVEETPVEPVEETPVEPVEETPVEETPDAKEPVEPYVEDTVDTDKSASALTDAVDKQSAYTTELSSLPGCDSHTIISDNLKEVFRIDVADGRFSIVQLKEDNGIPAGQIIVHPTPFLERWVTGEKYKRNLFSLGDGCYMFVAYNIYVFKYDGAITDFTSKDDERRAGTERAHVDGGSIIFSSKMPIKFMHGPNENPHGLVGDSLYEDDAGDRLPTMAITSIDFEHNPTILADSMNRPVKGLTGRFWRASRYFQQYKGKPIGGATPLVHAYRRASIIDASRASGTRPMDLPRAGDASVARAYRQAFNDAMQPAPFVHVSQRSSEYTPRGATMVPANDNQPASDYVHYGVVGAALVAGVVLGAIFG